LLRGLVSHHVQLVAAVDNELPIPEVLYIESIQHKRRRGKLIELIDNSFDNRRAPARIEFLESVRNLYLRLELQVAQRSIADENLSLLQKLKCSRFLAFRRKTGGHVA